MEQKPFRRFQNIRHSMVWSCGKNLQTNIWKRSNTLQHHLWGETSTYWAHLSVYCVPGFQWQCALLHQTLVMCTAWEGLRRVGCSTKGLWMGRGGRGGWASFSRVGSAHSSEERVMCTVCQDKPFGKLGRCHWRHQPEPLDTASEHILLVLWVLWLSHHIGIFWVGYSQICSRPQSCSPA